MTRESSDPFPAGATVRVYETAPKAEPDGQINAILGANIRINPAHLHRFSFADPSKSAVDFLTVLGAVWFADRAVRRLRGSAWGRKIHVVVPVLQIDRWTASRRVHALTDCANYLTGDQWTFEFAQRRRMPPEPSTKSVVQAPEGKYVGVPYSDGIDSYAQVRLLLNREPDANIICTFTAAKAGVNTWESLCRRSRRRKATKLLAVPVPVNVKAPKHPELTFRTRPLVFFGIAAYGAALANSNRVMIPENGQGSLGGSLVLLGDEAPHRSCYPGFLRRLSLLLNDCLDKEIAFEHPALLKTKGEVMIELAKIEPDLEWTSKWSCSHDQRHSSLGGKRVHCGVCGGCILRRTSMLAANVVDNTPYLFSDLRATTLKEALAGQESNAMRAMTDVAGNSARSMQRLADLAGGQSWPVKQVALDVAETESISPTAALNGVARLLNTHKIEWNGFLDHAGQESWISNLASA